jgi:hypothetical protein
MGALSRYSDNHFPQVSYLGLTGVLTPKGEFYECPYMQHIAFAEKLYYIEISKDKSLREQRGRFESEYTFLERMGYISMGSKGRGFHNLSHVRFPPKSWMNDDAEPKNVTIEQIQWFAHNFDMLDEAQQLFVARYMHLYVGKENGIDDQVEEQFYKLYMNKYPEYFNKELSK